MELLDALMNALTAQQFHLQFRRHRLTLKVRLFNLAQLCIRLERYIKTVSPDNSKLFRTANIGCIVFFFFFRFQHPKTDTLDVRLKNDEVIKIKRKNFSLFFLDFSSERKNFEKKVSFFH